MAADSVASLETLFTQMLEKTIYRIVGCVALMLLSVQPVFAGPGGRIARAAFETFWGRVALGMLLVLFLPLIVYTMLHERLATKRAYADLAFVAKHDSRFSWLNLKSRSKECFQRVHTGWQDENLSDVSSWMTPWYWQNQQSVFLDQWKSQGLLNVCNVKKITGVRPLLFVHRNHENNHEDSQVVIGITAKMQDYLVHQSTGKVAEGSKIWKEVETLWTFTITDGQWLVSDIEEDSYSLNYAKMRTDLPDIESTMKARLDA